MGRSSRLCYTRWAIYHYDQLAGWTDAEIAWVDEHLEGFRGRVTRDDWVAQARILAAGGETEFSKRAEVLGPRRAGREGAMMGSKLWTLALAVFVAAFVVLNGWRITTSSPR